MGNKNFIKRSIFKEKISELKSKKFSFEINRIELPNGHEGEYGQNIFATCTPTKEDHSHRSGGDESGGELQK